MNEEKNTMSPSSSPSKPPLPPRKKAVTVSDGSPLSSSLSSTNPPNPTTKSKPIIEAPISTENFASISLTDSDEEEKITTYTSPKSTSPSSNQNTSPTRITEQTQESETIEEEFEAINLSEKTKVKKKPKNEKVKPKKRSNTMKTFQATRSKSEKLLATIQTKTEELTKKLEENRERKKKELIEMASLEQRITSFASWIHTTPSAEDLAINGFFFTPKQKKPKRVKCYSCSLKVNSWKQDDIQLEHQRLSPNCSLVSNLAVSPTNKDSPRKKNPLIGKLNTLRNRKQNEKKKAENPNKAVSEYPNKEDVTQPELIIPNTTSGQDEEDSFQYDLNSSVIEDLQ